MREEGAELGTLHRLMCGERPMFHVEHRGRRRVRLQGPSGVEGHSVERLMFHVEHRGNCSLVIYQPTKNRKGKHQRLGRPQGADVCSRRMVLARAKRTSGPLPSPASGRVHETTRGRVRWGGEPTSRQRSTTYSGSPPTPHAASVHPRLTTELGALRADTTFQYPTEPNIDHKRRRPRDRKPRAESPPNAT